MMYRASDGTMFSTYQAFCQHQCYLSRTAEERRYWMEEKEKMDRRQRSIGARIFLFFLLPVTLPFCTLLGKPMNAINAVFGE
jgi:hypothetical protein